MTRNTHRLPFLLSPHSSRFRYLIRYSFIRPSGTLGLVGPRLLLNSNSLGFSLFIYGIILNLFFELITSFIKFLCCNSPAGSRALSRTLYFAEQIKN